MWEELLKAIPVYFLSMVKFILGPITGYAGGLNLVTTVLATVAGMMTVVLLFTFFGEFMRAKVLNRFGNRAKNFSERNRKFVKFWKKYGIVGVAALTPLVLTPIGGTVLAVSFGAPRNKLIFYMFISAAIWALIFTIALYFIGDEAIRMIEGYFTIK
jgi:membrane protein DedA with SNARE-associated domain